jgi:hypothetical protein
MKMKTPPFGLLLALAGAVTPLVVLAAFKAGGEAYTKRPETALLAEPKPLAATTTRVRYARPLKIEEVRGLWLRVSDGQGAAGWVFSGNLAEEKPDEVRGLDGLPVAASETTATAAARPLAPAAVDYGKRRGLSSASEDVKWLDRTADAITSGQIETFLQEQKKGEFK